MPTLVVGPNWVGDMIMAQSLVAFLKSKRPEDPIHMLAPSVEFGCCAADA